MECEFDDKVIKVDPKDLLNAARSKKRRVIMVAIGAEKAQAILSLIKRGWANVLVTDTPTAKEILKLHGPI